MPEGHTLHRLSAVLNDAFAGSSPHAWSPQGRFVDGAAQIDGATWCGAQAWGKHLFIEFGESRESSESSEAGEFGGVAADQFLHVHLGLIGSFDVTAYDPQVGPPPPVGAVRLRLVGPRHTADLRAMTLLAVETPERVDAVMARLGPDPLRADADPDRAWARITKSPRVIADLLMDQEVVAGIGNVYRSEILFRHRVDPMRPGREIRRQTWNALWEDLLLLMPIGVRLGQIVTMADQVHDILTEDFDQGSIPILGAMVSSWRPQALGGVGAVERRYYVYKRAGLPCEVCGSRVRTRVLVGRNLFWCGRCQRRR